MKKLIYLLFSALSLSARAQWQMPKFYEHKQITDTVSVPKNYYVINLDTNEPLKISFIKDSVYYTARYSKRNPVPIGIPTKFETSKYFRLKREIDSVLTGRWSNELYFINDSTAYYLPKDRIYKY